MERPLAQMLREEHGLSERRACEAVGLSRSVARYGRRPDRDEESRAMLLELAERSAERRFDDLLLLIRPRGLNWNHKRVHRVFCELRLNQRWRGKKATVLPSSSAAGSG